MISLNSDDEITILLLLWKTLTRLMPFYEKVFLNVHISKVRRIRCGEGQIPSDINGINTFNDYLCNLEFLEVPYKVM